MSNSDYQTIYYCDFRRSNGSELITEQPVIFVDQPSYFVVVQSVGFRKTWESGNRVVYTQVSMTDLTHKVSING
jgi:hypothetical protein